jgi:membrane protease YdiL (CAAX protease family)
MQAAQRAQARTPAGYATTMEMLMRAAPFTPRDPRELRQWTVLSITAGVCEELIYRGYLIWYASHFTGTGVGGLLLAVVLTSIAFGLVHIYQGVLGVTQVFAVGLAFGGLYVLSGSLWLPIAAHIAVDIASGRFAVHLHRTGPPDGGAETREVPAPE